jgi:hypothetical protein
MGMKGPHGRHDEGIGGEGVLQCPSRVHGVAQAVAHTILVIIFHLLHNQTTYRELGATYFDERGRQEVERRLVRRLEALGNTVTLQPKEPAA